MINLNIKKQLVLILVCICSGCPKKYFKAESPSSVLPKQEKSNSPPPTTQLENEPAIANKPDKKDPNGSTTEPQHEEITSDKPDTDQTKITTKPDRDEKSASGLPKDAFVVVYLHGLMMSASESNPLAEAIQNYFGNRVINIQLKCREELKSLRPSLDDQAKKVVAEIQETLRKRYPQCSKEELKALPINLFGHSQGGCLSIIIAINHSHELNINSIIPANAPLGGVEVLEKHLRDVEAYYQNAKPGLNAIGSTNESPLMAKIMAVILNCLGLKQLTDWTCKGMADLRSCSAYMSQIKAFSRDKKYTTPTLIIASSIKLPDLVDFDEKDKQKVYDFAAAYSKFITGTETGEHDILISTRSQLGRYNSFENLATSKDDLVYRKNVEIYISNDLHAYNLAALASNFTVSYGDMLYTSKSTIHRIIEFLDQHNPRQTSKP